MHRVFSSQQRHWLLLRLQPDSREIASGSYRRRGFFHSLPAARVIHAIRLLSVVSWGPSRPTNLEANAAREFLKTNGAF